MTGPRSTFDNFYTAEQLHSVPTDYTPLKLPPPGSTTQLVFPSAGLLHIYRPSRRRRIINRAVDRLEQSGLPGSEFAIAHLYDKYRRNLSATTLQQTGRVALAFLSFFQENNGQNFERITRKDIAAFVEREQDRGLHITSVKHHLATVYAFLQFLVDNQILSADILLKKIRIRLPEVLPKAIPAEDQKRLLAVIQNKRDRALILLLLHTGMRIGELLQVTMADIVLPERKILLYIGEKNMEGRVVYYSSEAEKALRAWLKIRKPDQTHLFYGNRQKQLSCTRAWMIMHDYLKKAGLAGKGYSLHSLRHTFATNLLNAGLRLEVLQQLLGHRSIDVTLRYARMSSTTRENEYFKAMAVIEKGENNEHHRVSSHLQKVFEEKKLLRKNR
ncbi:MAG: tyrosine-type recombinase/integrase [ANME-2 cluster archaeon]|nr:tyrosine-type recombinase/integrase [ANME-2 cluster archaeon]